MEQGRKDAIAIYLRLSSADGYGESMSIANQRAYLYQWAAKEGYDITAEYRDDGCTGTDFDRPGFQALMEAIKQHKIHTFATVDLSRLGRNYLEVGLLQEKIFPKLGVRYIAVADGYDSAAPVQGMLDPAVFKNILNDAYARDCSMKARRAKRTLQNQGKYLSRAPYGYKKDPNNKYHLLPADETAGIVRRIYREFLGGMSCRGIVQRLNEEGVPSPATVKRLRGRPYSYQWNVQTVRRILTEPIYAGHTVQHRRETVNYKVHSARMVPENEWIVVKNTHQPLALEEEQKQAKRLLQGRSGKQQKNCKVHLLAGLVFCGDCKGPMFAHPSGGKVYYICQRYAQSPAQHRCTGHHIREDQLELGIKNILRPIIVAAAEKMEASDFFDTIKKEGQRIEKGLLRCEEARRQVCKSSLAPEEIEEALKELGERREMLLVRKLQLQDRITITPAELAEKLLSEKVLDRSMLKTLVKRIEVYDKKEVKLLLAFTCK